MCTPGSTWRLSPPPGHPPPPTAVGGPRSHHRRAHRNRSGCAISAGRGFPSSENPDVTALQSSLIIFNSLRKIDSKWQPEDQGLNLHRVRAFLRHVRGSPRPAAQEVTPVTRPRPGLQEGGSDAVSPGLTALPRVQPTAASAEGGILPEGRLVVRGGPCPGTAPWALSGPFSPGDVI